MKVGILGLGEVGSAFYNLYPDPNSVQVRDKMTGLDEFSGVFEVLHVCIPWQQGFVGIVSGVIQEHAPAVVIVHSTVPVGTTEKIGGIAVHAPVRGVHPNIREGILTFPMFVGGENPESIATARYALRQVGVSTEVVGGSRASELLKLLDTTYYGVCIAFHGYAKELCDAHGADFGKVMTRANETYNAGYAILGKPNVRRPVLFPPNGRIGGHCVVPNAEILLEHEGGHPLLDAILTTGVK